MARRTGFAHPRAGVQAGMAKSETFSRLADTGVLAADSEPPKRAHTRGAVLTPRYAIVLDTRCPVDVSSSPVLQARNELVRDAGITELSCGLPYLSARDIPV
jgi:hypothetical protein